MIHCRNCHTALYSVDILSSPHKEPEEPVLVKCPVCRHLQYFIKRRLPTESPPTERIPKQLSL